MVTLPKHADKYRIKGSIWLIAVLGLFLFSACSHYENDGKVDKLNSLSYAYHYVSLDSVEALAGRALALAADYPSGKAEAYNNLAFVDIAKMEYEEAYLLLDSVGLVTDNQVELLVADVQLMRLCQRESKNKDFYDYRERAIRRMKRISEEEHSMPERLKSRYLYAKTEFAIVSSTYYYYVGLTHQATEAVAAIDGLNDIQKDTAQYLNYLYQIGSGGIIKGKPRNVTFQEEFEYLVKCYSLAQQCGMVYWEANSLQAISEHLLDKDDGKRLIADNKQIIKYLNEDDMPDSLLAGYFAQKSLGLFKEYGDVYQVAGALRTLSFCYWALGDYRSSLICLENALAGNANIEKSPSQVASIRECLSLVYSAMDDKYNSDINRNLYLDIQEETRQDKQLEARAEQLERISSQQSALIVSILILIVIVVILLAVFNKLGEKLGGEKHVKALLAPLERYEEESKRKAAALDERYEAASEELSISRLKLEKEKRACLDNRAKVFLVNSVLPYIDRMANEVKRLNGGSGDAERLAYIAELTDCINDYNRVLTHWIQIQQGKLNLHIESFNLDEVFGILAKSAMSFRLKGVRLDVERQDITVKADKTLTLFMLNTIADNARKFTPKGGCVKVYAVKTPEYVEVSVKDNGAGMSPEELSGIFNHKVGNGHGFGLANCKGIIDKYKKTSRIFNVCGLYAESEKGRGSRFSFRLPYGVARCLAVALSVMLGVSGLKAACHSGDYAAMAGAYADSAYYSNVNGGYANTIAYADSVFHYLNKQYKALRPGGKHLIRLADDGGGTPAEIRWFHDSVDIDYSVVLDIRNECAVAALALHEWDLYSYNNKVYTQLFKDMSADKGLADYCQAMQNSSFNKTVAVVLLVMLLAAVVLAYYFLYYRHVLYFRRCSDKIESINTTLLSDAGDEEKLSSVNAVDASRFPEVLRNVLDEIKASISRSAADGRARTLDIELVEDEQRRIAYEAGKFHVSNNVVDNSLSTLKHETMYYPSRIRQLVAADAGAAGEVVEYYRQLYSVLCRQVNAQAGLAAFECKKVPVKEFTGASEYVLGDAVLIAYLFDTLRKHCGASPADVSLSTARGEYAEFSIACRGLHLAQKQCDGLFTVPSADNIPFFVCRQIVRECAAQANLHGCGISVAPDGGAGVLVKVVLPRKAPPQPLQDKAPTQPPRGGGD